MDLDEALRRIVEEGVKLVDKCLSKASDGTTLFRPDGGGNYNALWTRDFCYIKASRAVLSVKTLPKPIST